MDIPPLDSAENQPITHPKYRQIALTVYVGVLILGLFGWLNETPTTKLFSNSAYAGLFLFCVAIAGLILLEIGRQTDRFGDLIRPPIHLVAQILFTTLAMVTAPHFYAQLLFFDRYSFC